MFAALRPYTTAGIAIVGAGVIAVAPTTVPPPDLPAVEVAAVDAVRTVSAEVALTALPEALLAAAAEAVAGTVTFFLETVPAVVLADIAAGRFGHAAAISIAAIAVGYSLPWAPLVSALANELPLPLGTFDGVLQQGLFLVNSPPSIPVDLLLLAANVVDGFISPADFPDLALAAITTRITAAVESIQKIVAAIGGALPVSALEFQTLAVDDELPDASADLSTAELSSQSITSVAFDASVGTATVTVDTATPEDLDENDAAAPGETGEQEDEPQEVAGEDESPDGATDLSDGNKAGPGVAGSDLGSGSDEESTTVVAEEGTVNDGGEPTEDAGEGGAGDDASAAE
ncbi:hypothetical protein ABGB19_19290 [Mycobacterium sp. B14F4]|uniref:hypothetical protein n=1 Tax=Mycobacterium sp. B14F4 TaxID=3153565 RepID=UPI00325CECFE